MDEPDGKQNANPLSGVLKAAAPRNEFGSRRTVACAMMDSALLMANISQLRLILSDGHRPQFYTALLCCVIASIVFQIIFAALIMLIWTRDCSTCSDQKPTDDRERLDSSNSSRSPPPVDRRTGPRHFSWASLGHSFTVHVSGKGKDDDGDVQQDVVTQRLHCASVLLVFVITVLNMFIAGLGLEQKHVAAA
ncbi:hypothetical protein BaRGS_00008778 [Batillaria attramentaria]|uniref:Uncharacterized protein n=1 Tax=Batillaria attramentaria TaxID=370345 RepID=A0ABD0LKE9_9CAEN